MKIETYKALTYNGKEFSLVDDYVSIEVALSISINEVPFTLTMQTPGKEAELVRGLLFTENILIDKFYAPTLEIKSKNEKGFINSINVQVEDEIILRDFEGTRNLMSSASCGICGKTSLDNLDCNTVINSELLNPDLIFKMFNTVNTEQKDFQKSGGTHAAAAFDINGDLLCLYEDIGRHNAVDKVIGHLLNANLLAKAKCLTVSGRISYEIVSKTKVAGIPFLAAVSAPSSLAIEYAQQAGITLMAFCRNKKFTIYSNPQQVAMNDEILAIKKIKDEK